MTQSIGELERWNGGFPGDHEFSTLEGLGTPPPPELEVFFGAARHLVEDWQGNKFAGLYLYGTPGTGKTHAAIGLGRELHNNGAEISYAWAPTLDNKNASTRSWARVRHIGNKHNCDMENAFPAEYANGVERNPKSVLIFDDYQPDAQPVLAAATEAAAQFGGLIVVTSNYTDPFKLLETPKRVPTIETATLETMLSAQDPEALKEIQSGRQEKERQIADSLRSRITAGFKFIEFTGPDHRQLASFWD